MCTRFVVVGLGRMGQQHCKILEELDGTTLAAGVDTEEAARDRFEYRFRVPAYDSISEATLDLAFDAALIATPHAMHYEQAKSVLESEIAAFVEKPITTDPDDAAELVSLARDDDLALGVGYQRRYLPPVQEIKRRIATGEIGIPRMVSCHLGQNWLQEDSETWRDDPDVAGGGILYDTGSHLLEELLWLLGGVPTTVTAVADHRGTDVDANLAISLQISSGDADITTSVGMAGESTDLASDEQITIWGSEGRLEYRADRRVDDSTRLQVMRSGRPTIATTFDSVRASNPDKRKLQAFVHAVEEGTVPPVSGASGLVLEELRTAIKESYETGQTVDVGSRIAQRDMIENPFSN